MAKQKKKTQMAVKHVRTTSWFLLAVLLGLAVYVSVSAGTLGQSDKVSGEKLLINGGEAFVEAAEVVLEVVADVDYEYVRVRHFGLSQVYTNNGPYISLELQGADGEKLVAVELLDAEQRILQILEASVVLDREAPDVPVVNYPDPRISLPIDQLLWRGVAEPEVNIYLGIDNKVFRTRSQADGTWGMRAPVEVTGGRTHDYCVLAIDDAGHQSAESVCSNVTLIK